MQTGTQYLGKKKMIKPTAPDFDLGVHPGKAMWDEYTQPWLALDDDDRAIAILSNSEVYTRYKLAQKYGPQLYNYVTNGGITL